MLQLRYSRLICVFLAAAAVGAGVWQSARTQSQLRRVTNTAENGISINPSISGDGHVVAFESTADIAGSGGPVGFRAIHANVSIDPATFVQLGVTRAPAPAISQDGSRVAFASKDNPLGTNSDANSEIFLYDGARLIQVTDTSPRDISTRAVDGNFQPSITDDGRLIAFSSNRDLVNQNADGNLEIFVFDSATLSFTQLTNSTGIVGASDAKLSGNGANVAYIRDTGATASVNRDLLLQNRAGMPSVRTLAANAPLLALGYGRAISDDGTRVVWSAQTATNTTQVFLYDGRNDNTTRQITTLGSRAVDVPLHPSISGDGTKVSFATRRSVSGQGNNSDASVELYTFDIPSGTFGRVTNVNASDATAEVVSSMNDNGSIVAFNFPRLLSGTVSQEIFANNSEIYLSETPPRPASGNITVLNRASLGHEPSTTKAVAPDSIAVALGASLAFTTQQAQPQTDGAFPTTLGGTSITVNGRPAEILFVSPNEVHFHVPPATVLGIAEVVVTNSDGFQSRGNVTTLKAAPGIFTKPADGLGEGIILNADTLQAGSFDPTGGSRRLIVFATGVRNGTNVSVAAAGRALTLESIVQTSNLPGMDEIHLLVPADLRGAGRVDLAVRADGRDSNSAALEFSGDALRDILINEFLADPPEGAAGDANRDGVRDSADDEFVELVNTTTHDIDLGGYRLFSRGTASDTLRHVFAAGTIFPSCSSIVVFGGGNAAFNPDDAAFGGAVVAKASTGSLSLVNSGGIISLQDRAGAIVNLVAYGGSSPIDADNNQSVTRSPDTSGNFAPHLIASGGARAFSPALLITGSSFVSCTPAISRIEVSPPSASVNAGARQQFTARAFDAGNNQVPGVIFSWRSSDTSVATIDQNGLAGSVAAGAAEIRATGRRVESPPVMLTVNPLAPPNVVINEVDSDQAGTDTAEFVEIYDGGSGNTSLDGLVVIFYNGSNDESYAAFDLDGFSTNAGGYFTLGSSGVSGVDLVFNAGTMQNGADAVAIYVGNASSFPNGTHVTTTNLIDALVYDTNDADDPGLLALLNPGQPQINEDAGGNGETNSNQRCPNGLGGAGNTSTYNQFAPTPDSANVCIVATPPPALSINDVSVNEGDAGPTVLTFTISLSAPAPAGGVTFNIANADNTATAADNDYVAKSLTGQTIAAGNQTYSFEVIINGDVAVELDEVFLVNITNVTGASVADSQGLGTIFNDDSPVLSINDVATSEGDLGTTTYTFTVTSSLPAPAGGITFHIATADGTAQDDNPASEDNDYLPRSLTAQTISAGNTTYTFEVTVNGDSLVEGNETFLVNLTNVTGAVLSDGTGQGTIQNDDTANLVISQVYGGGGNSGASFSNDFVEIFNRGTSTVSFAATSYSVQYAAATANFGSSKVDLTSGTIAPGQYFLVRLSSGGTNGSPLPTPDATGGINLAAAAGKVALVSGISALTGSACPFAGSVADFVGYGVTADCFEGAGRAPAPGNTTAVLRKLGGCTETNDNAADFLAATPNPRNTASTINDCNAPPDVTIDDVTIAEGDAGSAVATFTVSLSRPAPPAGVTFDIATQNNTATSSDNDYVPNNLVAQTIPAGNTTYSFNVTVNGDMTVEPDEIFFVNLSNVTGAVVLDGQGLGTIQNDDSAPLPGLSLSDISQSETNSGTTTFTFTVSSSLPASAGGITFDIATADGTAHDDMPPSEDNDYVARSLLAQTITEGNTTYTFDVAVNGDTLVEANETFFVNLTNVFNATVFDGQGQGTIQNDDTANLVISQVYGGGGNASATYTNDFIEIFNRGTSIVDFSVTPYSVQYAAATSNFATNKTDITSGIILPGHYFLIREASGGAAGAALPAPDVSTGTINMAATAGKVALVAGTTALTGSGCPLSATVMDFLGYGTTANCFETAPIAVSGTNSNARSLIRIASCTDTNNNSVDFGNPSTAPVARNSTTIPTTCP
jgi:uncharacterized protein (TIGR03437 family)